MNFNYQYPAGNGHSPQYPPFNPNTAAYAAASYQTQGEELIDPALRAPQVAANPPTYYRDPDHDVNGLGGAMGLNLEQYTAGQRAPTVPMAPPSNASASTSNGHKRRRSTDQVCQFIF